MTKPEFKDDFIFNIKKIEQIEPLLLTAAGQTRLKNAVEKSERANQNQKKQIQKNIETAGFTCLQCGKCCERTEADNSVYILPEEIEQIEAAINLSRNEFILPMLPDYFESAGNIEKNYLFNVLQSLDAQIDKDGQIHTFGWMLQRKNDGSCIFLDSETKKCAIYEIRPGLCRTYPFYIDEDGFSDCECDGIGKVKKTDEIVVNDLIAALQKRVISDQEDYIKTSAVIKEKYDRLKLNSDEGNDLLKEQFEKNTISFVVYDSTGVYSVDVLIKMN
ncbi:YkgJ family cysteine cluster protein [Methanimicrococcus sp. OttesenSCG-928-J09]|nr:YkgJ family cysteine cluster protein [Methanimicrococcus sp. OttesenSCG-928-J09]